MHPQTSVGDVKEPVVGDIEDPIIDLSSAKEEDLIRELLKRQDVNKAKSARLRADYKSLMVKAKRKTKNRISNASRKFNRKRK